MPFDSKTEALPTRVRASYQKLLSAATELNSASDRFSKLVAEIDSTLKPLNIGITCWVKMSTWGSEHSSGCDQVGYTKVGGKWCIALSTVEEFHNGRDDDWDVWAFADGPRRLRLEAIDHLPSLLETLAKEAAGETKKLNDRTDDLQQLVAALKESVKK